MVQRTELPKHQTTAYSYADFLTVDRVINGNDETVNWNIYFYPDTK